MTGVMVPIVLYIGFLLYHIRMYTKKVMAFYSIINSPVGNYNIHDRNGLLVFHLRAWGLYLLIAVISTHILWFITLPMWFVMLIVQKHFVVLWQHNGYSVKVFIGLNAAVIILFFSISPAIRTLILERILS